MARTESENKTGSVVKTLGIHHSGIPVNDLERAVDFYTRVLGWELIGIRGGPDGAGHFLGGNTPPEVTYTYNPEGEKDYLEWVDQYRAARAGHTPTTHFARMRVGPDEVVLFKRPEPIELGETLIENGIFHQSFHISPADMQHLVDLKREGGSDIRFHTGPVLRWPHGRALYLWDTEGNYIELESEEDLPAQFGVSH